MIGRLVLATTIAGLGLVACLSPGGPSGPAPLMQDGLTVETGYTPSEIPYYAGEFPVFVLHWNPSQDASYFLVAVSSNRIDADNWDAAVVVDTIAAGQDSAWVEFQPDVFDNTCIGCGICVDVCPHDAITLVDGRAVIDANLCTACGQCILNCPVQAISDNHFGAFYYFAVRAFSSAGVPSETVACTSTRYRMIYENDLARCAHCGDPQTGISTCFAVIDTPPCPVDAIFWDEDMYIHIDYDKCIHCGQCFMHCWDLNGEEEPGGLHSISHKVEAEP